MKHPCFFLASGTKLVRPICLLLSFFLSASCASSLQFSEGPRKAAAGHLDLRGWDFVRKGPARLDGEWEFHWGELRDPFRFESPAPGHPEYFLVPGTWKGRMVDGKKLPGVGYATYRLRILVDPGETDLAIRTITASTAFRLYVNGKPANYAGTVGSNQAESKPAYSPMVMSIDGAPSGCLDLVLQVSNFHYRTGGFWRPMWIGRQEDLSRQKRLLDIKSAFLFGSLLIMSLYHFALFLMRKRDRQFLYLSLLCLLVSLRSVFTGEYVVTEVFPGIPFGLLIRGEYLAFALAIPAVNYLFRSLYPDEYLAWEPKIVLAFFALFSAFILATPPAVFTRFIVPCEAVAAVAIVYIIGVILAAFRKRQKGAALLLVGIVILAATELNDVLYSNFLINTANLVDAGMTVFVFFQAMVLSLRFTAAFSDVENLTGKLDALNNDLERQVKSRTKELENALESLKSISEHDLLTGCFNRKYLDERFPTELLRALRYDRPFSLIMADLDHFKQINDQYGHPAGDAVLERFGVLLRSEMRDDIDFVFRYGGEEFLVILPETAPCDAAAAAERLRRISEQQIVQVGSSRISFTASFGVTGFVHGKEEPETTMPRMLEAVDRMLYRAKSEGRNRVAGGK